MVDDGSTDGSAELLRQYGDRIQLAVFPKNRGALEARNYGASLATGDYLVFLDGDDLLTPWSLDVYGSVIRERDPKLIIGAQNTISKGWMPSPGAQPVPTCIEFVDYPTLMAKDRPFWVGASVFVVDRQEFLRVGGWTPDIFEADLWDILAKLGQAGRAVCILSPPTSLYRIHESNTIHNVRPFIRMVRRILQKERDGLYCARASGMLRFQRRAWFGGVAAFWVKRGLREGLYREAAGLALSGSGLILSAIMRRLLVVLRGRSPVSTSVLESCWKSAASLRH